MLRVTATFRNDARWAQPWPRLRLTLTDGNGRPAGERSFDAHEYLGGAPNQPLLAGGESAAVAMDILEPVSYTHLDVYKRQILADVLRQRAVGRVGDGVVPGVAHHVPRIVVGITVAV